MTRRTHFDHLSHSVGNLSRWEGGEECKVHKDVARLPESANEVLAVRSVNGCLASD